MKNKNSILLSSSLLSIALIICTSITPALGHDDMGMPGALDDIEGQDGASITGNDGTSVSNQDLQEVQITPPEDDPPECYPCFAAIIIGLNNSRPAIRNAIESFPRILDYEPSVAGLWNYIDDVSSFIVTIIPNLVNIIRINLNDLGFYPAEILGEAIAKGFEAVVNFTRVGVEQFLGGEINFPFLTTILASPSKSLRLILRAV